MNFRCFVSVFCSLLFFEGIPTISTDAAKQPHVIFILADDLGWNDVGFHGANEVWTPNIDALAYSGLILNSHYSENLCTPSRAALLTGKYPVRTGMQHNVIIEASPWGLPLSEKLLPQRLNDLGYDSHAIGKWHLGFFKKAYTPTQRGFASHYGFWSSHHDYFTHRTQASFLPYEGLDLRDDMTPDWSNFGRYTTRLLTEKAERVISNHNTKKPLFLYLAHLAAHAGNFDDPLQAPPETIDMFKHIQPMEKRIYAAMLWELDKSVGQIVTALSKRGMLRDSIIAFVSDNGAPTTGLYKNRGNNWPFRGEKNTPWEGALRTVAAVWSTRISAGHRVMNHLMHLTDWMPTFYAAGGGNITDLGQIDGVSHWDFFTRQSTDAPRNEVLHNIDDISQYSALRMGAYKYVNGTTFLGCLDGWYGSNYSAIADYNISAVLKSSAAAVFGEISPNQVFRLREKARVACPPKDPKEKFSPCHPKKGPCLFNVQKDPCERNNIYNVYNKGTRHLVDLMERKLDEFRAVQVPPGNRRPEKSADPKLYNGTWANWGDGISSCKS